MFAQRLNVIKPFISLRTVIVAINLCVIILFFVWLSFDIPITKWGATTIKSSSYFESLYWTKSYQFWSNSLNSINSHTSHPKLRTELLKIYVAVIPVDQWWTQLRIFKESALNSLIEMYTQDSDWTNLKSVSSEYIVIDPNEASGWFHAAIADENLGNTEEAIAEYSKAIDIDMYHTESVKNLSKIYLSQGKYYESLRILQSALEKVSDNGTLCLYWAADTYLPSDVRCIEGFPKLATVDISDIVDPTVHNIRFDPPEGTIHLKSVTLNKPGEKSVVITDFSDLELSPDYSISQTKTFVSTGNDPYFSIEIDDQINFESFDSITLNSDFSPKVDEELVKLLYDTKQALKLSNT